MDIQQVLDKYFKDEKTLYFHQSDQHSAIEGDTYLKYAKNGGIELWMGGNNSEVCILFTRDSEVLEKMIYLIINGRSK
jgi:hypothetical protein